MNSTYLRLVSSPPTDATRAWEAARPKSDDNPKISPEFRAIVETADAARGGVDTLIEALRAALQLAYERDDYDDVCAHEKELEEENKGAQDDLAAMTDRALLAEGRYKDLGEAYRSIIGDDPGAALLATYWHGQAKANAAELIALRRFVNEIETQRASRRKKKP